MNRLYFISAVAIVAAAVGCNKPAPDEPKEDPAAQADTTKIETGINAVINGEGIAWSRKDLISVFSADKQCPGAFEATDKGTESWFNGIKRKDDVLKFALHPYNADARVQGVLLMTQIPNEQDGKSKSIVLAGSSSDGQNFTLKQCSARIRFTIPENAMISSLKFQSDEGLAGDVKILVSKSKMEFTGTGEAIRVSADSDAGLEAGEYIIDAVPSSTAKTIVVTYNGGDTSDTFTLSGGLPVGTTDIGELNFSKTLHPCIMFKSGDEEKIMTRIHNNYDIRILHDKIIAMADASIGQISVYNVPKGGNMLYVSRGAVQYLSSMSYAYRMTGDRKYLNGVIAELEAVCNFQDWDPDHYLDMGEMATAVAIAYDWLFNDLPATTKKLCETALEEKALDTYFSGKYTSRWWYQVNNNRNQVCATGLYLAARAIQSIIPKKAAIVISDMLESIKVAVDGYDPDGAYPEGAGYWTYGTCYNALMNYTMECNGEKPYYGNGGFYKTIDYNVHLKGPSGNVFNYSDGGAECDVDMGPFYFAQLRKDTNLLWWELKAITKDFTEANRLITFIMPMIKDLDIPETTTPPASLTWYGKGITPVYFARTSWNDPDASWFGIKGGYANTSHAHMDGGSFVFEALGERWVIDLGGESYTTLTNNGVNQGDLSQNSERWNVLTYAPSSHSCIRIDNDRLLVANQAVIESIVNTTERQGAVLNVGKLYNSSKVKALTREAYLLMSSGIMEIKDAVATNAALKYTFTIPTDKNTSATIIDSRTVRLARGSKYVDAIISPSDPSLATTPVAREIKPDNTYEKANARAVDFECSVPAGVNVTFTIRLVPMGADTPKEDIGGGGTVYDREDLTW